MSLRPNLAHLFDAPPKLLFVAKRVAKMGFLGLGKFDGNEISS
jgi:hypothetical protein